MHGGPTLHPPHAWLGRIRPQPIHMLASRIVLRHEYRGGTMPVQGSYPEMIRKMWLAGAFVLAAAGTAGAQTIVDGSQVDEIVNIARGYGAATLEEASTGDPM